MTNSEASQDPEAEVPLDETVQRRKRKKTWKGFFIRLAIVIVVLEVALRVGVYAVKGKNPYYLYYGFQGVVSQAHVSPWSVYDGQYYKYPPGYELSGAAGQKGETAHVNSLGFRGVDFAPEKAPGTFRIVSMGGSSTFGFHNDDDETYPFYLQERFREAGSYDHVEVINAGFPYYNTATIRGLFEEEILAYDPDVLTIYCGYNDASWPLETGAFVRAVSWLQQRSIVVYVFKETLVTDKRFYQLYGKLRRLLPGEDRSDEPYVDAEGERIATRFRANLDAILAACRASGTELVLVRQPITIRHQDAGLGAMSYADEAAEIRRRLRAGEQLSEFERRMVWHRRLVDEADALAEAEGLRVVDNIAIVDEDRTLLDSWVHLKPEGNRRLAASLFDSLAPLATSADG